MALPMTEPEVLGRAMTLVAGLGGLGWAFFGMKFDFAKKAAIQFGVANILLVLGDMLAMLQSGAEMDMLAYYRSFNLADVMTMGCVMLFRSGMLDLYDRPCSSPVTMGTVACIAFAGMLAAHWTGYQNAAMVAVLLGSAWFALVAFVEASRILSQTYTRAMCFAFLWPMGAAGLLFLFRAGDDMLAMWQHQGALGATFKETHISAFLWGQLLVLVLVNASLIGQTLNALIKKLNDQTARLQNILDTAPVGVSVTSGGVIQFANPRLGELVDVKVGDKATAALVHPQTEGLIEAEIASKGTVRDLEIQMYCPNHTVRDLLVTYMPTQHNGTAGTLSWMVDITDRKKNELAVQQASDELNAIFESATMGIAFIKEWNILRANHRMDELFGWGPGELLGQSPRTWFLNPQDISNGPYADIMRGDIHYSTQQLRRKDGSTFWSRVSGAAIDPKDLNRGTVWIFDDVTEERKAAELMREAKELAEDATQMKSNFLANMSHEIRTPMNAIVGMSQLVLKTELTPKQRNYIEKVDAAAHNLLGIINDILDFSKIEAGKMQFERREFFLEDVLENLADLSVIKAQDKGLELLFDVAPDVPTALVGDSLRLGQVMLNLVGNAIKFTERGEVTLGIRVEPAGGAAPAADQITLRFDVTDSGVGLSEEQRNKLFSAFSQADASTTRKYGGTGLGLTISKRLVELMDGDISVHSVLGAGSTFSFTARFGLQTSQRTRPPLEADVTGLRVLVVDDNARAREILLAMLESQKFDASAVASGADALSALEQAASQGRPYGLVLMDWMMPTEDGLSAINRIRQAPHLTHTPAFVMVTAHSRDELLEQAGATRIDGVLLKPVGPSALLDSILCALGKEVVSHGRKHQRKEANQDALHKVRGSYLLLVEDNPVNQELALEVLQEASIRVDVANHGAQALEMVKKHDYDGILMDCQMPVMDGFEATRLIRANPAWADLPILAMTANAMSGDRELCLEAGMNDHIGKPIDVNQLFTTLAQWVKPSGQGPQTNGTPAAPANPDTLPAIEGLDLAQAMRRMGGNAALIRKLLGRFVQSQTLATQRIYTALEANDVDAATREAHTLKGLAGNIGASMLAEHAQELETALRQGQQTQAQQALPRLEEMLKTLIAAISLALPAQDVQVAAGTTAVDTHALFDDLRELAVLLADDDARASKLMERIAPKLQAVGQTALATQMQKQLMRYEFDEGLDTLRTLATAMNLVLPA